MKTPETLKLEKRRDTLLAWRGIVRMSERVWTSVLYDVSNVTMIVGDHGIILVDTGMIPENARATLDEFRKITDKPVKAVIYTHGHGDHTGASPVFAAEGKDVEVWARSNFGAETLPFEQAGLMPLFSRPERGREVLPCRRKSASAMGFPWLCTQRPKGLFSVERPAQ